MYVYTRKLLSYIECKKFYIKNIKMKTKSS